MYCGALGRWLSVDPLAEEYYQFSTYHFSGNNPAVFVDSNGMNYIYSGNGQYQRLDGSEAPWAEVLSWMQDPANGDTYRINGNEEYVANDFGMLQGELLSSVRFMDFLGAISGMTATLGDFAGISNATFRLTDSRGMFDFKL